jgi:hypothetical protein
MAGDEVTAVHQRAFERGWTATLDGEVLAHVMAVVAALLRMTGLAERSRLSRSRAVPALECVVMPHERAGKEALHVLALVAGRALGALPLLAVLVTVEAAVHGRIRRLGWLGDTGVAADALPPHLGQRQV